MYKVKVVDNIFATIMKKDMTFSVPFRTKKEAEEWITFDIRSLTTAYKNEGKVFKHKRTGKKANGWVEGIDEYWINYEIVNE